MHIQTRLLIACGLVFGFLMSGCDRQQSEAEADNTTDTRPNILLIVADDLGYSDVGVYGSEIATPNIDALAGEGVMFTQFHVWPNCGPTRGAMMTGVDPHRAGMASNHGGAAENQKGMPGYEGHLRGDVVTIAQLTRDAGYHTYMTGKWHLGDEQNNPAARGFEKSFALLNGAASHWADQVEIIPGDTTRYISDGQLVDELPADFYSSEFYTNKLISYIDSEDDAPFFAYLSFTAPHNPLHVPAPYIEKYRGRFDAGWDALVVSRMKRLKEMDLVSESQEPHPRPDWVMGWDELPPEQQASRARDMEIYAGMVDFVDEQIGRVLDHLRENGRYDDTLIVFLSDNGPSKTSITDYLAMGGDTGAFFESFDNSLSNKGLPGSSTDIGPGWAYASATPLRLFKGYVAQGGIQVPAVIKAPGVMPNAGSRTDAITHVMDLMPTFLSVAKTEYPDQYEGVSIVPLLGQSLLPTLDGQASVDDEPREIGWSAYGMDAFRSGDWKVIRLPKPFGNGEWQLYNLKNDPGEMHDLASENPETVASMSAAWEDYAKANGVIVPSEATYYAKPIKGRKY